MVLTVLNLGNNTKQDHQDLNLPLACTFQVSAIHNRDNGRIIALYYISAIHQPTLVKLRSILSIIQTIRSLTYCVSTLVVLLGSVGYFWKHCIQTSNNYE